MSTSTELAAGFNPDPGQRVEEAARELRGSLAFFPKLIKPQTARRMVPYPLFPETWLSPGFIPGGYLAAWCQDKTKKDGEWGALGFLIWSAYGRRKGFYVSQAVVNQPDVRTHLQVDWAVETALMGLRKSPHPFLFGVEAESGESGGPMMASWSILPFVTGSAPVSFLSVKKGRAHAFNVSIQGRWRLAAGDVHGKLSGLFPDPGWRPVFAMQIRNARVRVEWPSDVDLKSPGRGAPRTVVAPAGAS